MRQPWRLAVLWGLSTGAAWACSGPGAGELMEQNELIGMLSHAVCVGLMLISSWVAVRRKVVGSPIAAGWVLVISHPNIWSSARGGDCGQSLRSGSLLFLAVTIGLLAYAWLRPPKPPPPAGEE